jgi:hypothetical protein
LIENEATLVENGLRTSGVAQIRMFLRLNDPQQSILYLDLYSGRVAKSHGRWERLDRWLYHGLHDFDVPGFIVTDPSGI